MKLFSYGIFMSRSMREVYNIPSPAYYDTVKGYATIGGYIVQAVPDVRYTLTGMLFEVPDEVWPFLDRTESGYERITVTTTYGSSAQMYVRPMLESLLKQPKQTRGREYARTHQVKDKCCESHKGY